MFVVFRQDSFGAKPIELYHTDHKELADKYQAEYVESAPSGILVYVQEQPGANTRANAEKEAVLMAKKGGVA